MTIFKINGVRSRIAVVNQKEISEDRWRWHFHRLYAPDNRPTNTSGCTKGKTQNIYNCSQDCLDRPELVSDSRANLTDFPFFLLINLMEFLELSPYIC